MYSIIYQKLYKNKMFIYIIREKLLSIDADPTFLEQRKLKQREATGKIYNKYKNCLVMYKMDNELSSITT